MPTLRYIWPRNVVRRRPGRFSAAALVVVLSALWSIAATGDASSAPADGPRGLAVGELVAPAADVVSDVRVVAADATARMVDVATPPPPPPVFCPTPGSEFVDSWGFARSGGRRHKGVDMMAPHGTPVYAPVAGTIRSSDSALGGLGFYLDDADGNTYFGSHLASLERTGQVQAGDRIGTVGSTGNASTPHLHFEVMLAGRGSVNPYPFAAAWCGLTDVDPFAR